MKLSRAQIQNLANACTSLRGVAKVVRDKDGHPVVRPAEKSGDSGQPLVENQPFQLTVKARYAVGRTLEACGPITRSINEATNGAVAEAMAAKTRRLIAADPKAAAAQDISPNDPESGTLQLALADLVKAEEEIAVHATPIEGLNLAANPDLSPETLAGLMPMLTGEL